MKNLSRRIIKKLTGYVLRRTLTVTYKNISQGQNSLWDCIMKLKVFYDKKPGTISSAKLFAQMIRQSDVLCIYEYIYTYDPLKIKILPNGINFLASITPDYSVIIKSNIKKIMDSMDDSKDSEFFNSQKVLIDAIVNKADQIKRKKYKTQRYKHMATILPDLLYRDCRSLDEAIQKLLFYNGLFWQAKHYHNGLGRLDMILYPYYKHDIEHGVIDRGKAKQMIINFCYVLGSQTYYKSPSLIGDTGQYILLGGIDEKGINVDNELTHLFLEVFTEIRVPDPKLIIRVNNKTLDSIWKEAIQCVMNGCGSPLFMNETLIMSNMVKFGYDKADVWNLGTSACWEPLIIGKSSDQNNPFSSIVACKPLNDVICSAKEYSCFKELVEDVKQRLFEEAKNNIKDLDFDYSPLMSLFMPECQENGCDFSHKGSKYMYQGVQLVGFPNLINALLNIKEFVFEKQITTLSDCKDVIMRNYGGREDLKQLFTTHSTYKFGKADTDVLSLCEDIINTISESIKNLTSNDMPVKFGLSSPNYVSQAKAFPATLDGRKAGEPFAVHISPISSTIDLSEVLKFAGQINYPANCLNGNVVDFILPSVYQKQIDKFVNILKDAFANGVFQLQLNVLDKITLMDAKQYPEKYPNLVVRVWGFSAYFNDLPEEYKNNLIARAAIYERA